MNSIDKNWVDEHIDSNGVVVIPEGVEKIEAEAFMDNQLVKKVVMPNTIIEIGEKAFARCSNLEDIEFSSKLKVIDAYAFSYCEGLKTIEMGSNSQLKKLGDHAFYLCKNIEKISLPNTLQTLEKATFAGCYQLSSVDLGNGIESIGNYAFNSCKNLESITVPDSLKKISVASFCDCESLTNINNGQNIEEIGAYAFEKTNIENFKLPSRVKEVTYKMFDGGNLTELYLGENTEKLNNMALAGCENLKKLSINERLSFFPETALEGVDNLEEVEINGTPRINYGSFKGKSSIKKIVIDGNEYSLEENEELFALQRHKEKVVIVVTDKDGLKSSRCINLEKGTQTKRNMNMYLANDGSVVKSINSTADISIEELNELKQRGIQKIYIYGSTRDIKLQEHEAGIEYDLYSIDDLIQIKTIIQEIKQGIKLPPKEDKHRQKKIYSQLVRKLSEKMEYDYFELYMSAKTEEGKEAEKTAYEKNTQGKWEEYWEQNQGRSTKESMLEAGNLLGLIKGRAVCRGNVEIIRNIAAEFGIEALGIIGAKHIWNQVNLDGIWYDDDFTNYQSYLSRGNLEETTKRFLCGQIEGKSEFSKIKLYSITYNQPHEVGKSYSIADKKFLLNYGRKQQQSKPELTDLQKAITGYSNREEYQQACAKAENEYKKSSDGLDKKIELAIEGR